MLLLATHRPKGMSLVFEIKTELSKKRLPFYRSKEFEGAERIASGGNYRYWTASGNGFASPFPVAALVGETVSTAAFAGGVERTEDFQKIDRLWVDDHLLTPSTNGYILWWRFWGMIKRQTASNFKH